MSATREPLPRLERQGNEEAHRARRHGEQRRGVPNRECPHDAPRPRVDRADPSAPRADPQHGDVGAPRLLIDDETRTGTAAIEPKGNAPKDGGRTERSGRGCGVRSPRYGRE